MSLLTLETVSARQGPIHGSVAQDTGSPDLGPANPKCVMEASRSAGVLHKAYPRMSPHFTVKTVLEIKVKLITNLSTKSLKRPTLLGKP